MSHYRLLYGLAWTAGIAGLAFAWAMSLLGWFLLFVIVWIVTLASADLLVRNLPESLSEMQIGNGVRQDGTRSRGRQRIETMAREKLRWNAWLLLGLLAFPNIFLLWLTNREVLPISVATEAVSQMDSDPEVWAAKIKNGPTEQKFDRWKRQKSGWMVDGESHKRWLWRGWPVLAAVYLGWFGMCAVLMRGGYLYLLRGFERGARERADQYFYRDLGRMDGWAGEPVHARSGRRRRDHVAT